MSYFGSSTKKTVKILSKKFAVSEIDIMFVMKLKMTITSVIVFFKSEAQLSS